MANGGGRASKAPVAARQRLNRDVVVAAARSLLDDGGSDALTMARLGEVLRVTPMAIYRHVADRGELIRGATETVLAEMTADLPATSDWASGIAGWMRRLRRHWLAHPWLEPFLGTPAEQSEQWLAVSDVLARLLFKAGLSPRLVAHELALISRMTIGILAQEVAAPLPGPDAFGAAMTESLDPAGRRRWQSVAKALSKYTNDQLFADLITTTVQRIEAHTR